MEPRGLGHTAEELSTGLEKLVLVLQVTRTIKDLSQVDEWFCKKV